MGCVLWRCEFVKCPNRGICDEILCIRFLKHECAKCVNRENCVAYKNLDSTVKGVTNEKKNVI